MLKIFLPEEFPIYEQGKNGESLLPGYVLDKTVLSEEEKTDILSALQSLNALDKSSVEETLSKLSSFLRTFQGYYEIDLNDGATQSGTI